MHGQTARARWASTNPYRAEEVLRPFSAGIALLGEINFTVPLPITGPPAPAKRTSPTPEGASSWPPPPRPCSPHSCRAAAADHQRRDRCRCRLHGDGHGGRESATSSFGVMHGSPGGGGSVVDAAAHRRPRTTPEPRHDGQRRLGPHRLQPLLPDCPRDTGPLPGGPPLGYLLRTPPNQPGREGPDGPAGRAPPSSAS